MKESKKARKQERKKETNQKEREEEKIYIEKITHKEAETKK